MMPDHLRAGIDQMNSLGRERTPFLFVIDYAMRDPLFYPLDSIDPQRVLFDIQGSSNVGYRKPESHNQLQFEKFPVNFRDYQCAFDQVMGELRYGNSFLLNLTFSTPIKINRSLKDIFLSSKAKYKLWIADQFVVFSPETFVRINNGMIYTYPMKGTIDASMPDAHAHILGDAKETAEHITIVDLLRNDLSRVAEDVQVTRFRFVEEVHTHERTLLQVSSEIRGNLPPGYHEHLGEIIYALLPAGSVTGAPKRKTVEILHAAETHERGYFTGIFGYFDGTQLDSAVMIRFIERQGNQLIYKSGGGITTQSIAQEEYKEMIDKVYVPVY